MSSSGSGAPGWPQLKTSNNAKHKQSVTIQPHAMAKYWGVWVGWVGWMAASCQNPKPQTIKQNCKLDVI